jgi:hypothetical protein
MDGRTIQIIAEMGVAVGIAAEVACLFFSVYAHFKAIANRMPGVTWWRAFNWMNTMFVRRNVYLKDLFTDAGRWWLKVSFMAFLGFLVAVGMAAAVGVATVFLR